MTIGSITNKFFIKTLSGLANNNDSIVPMAVKDLTADVAIVDTYAKEGTKEDAAEKAIEEIGTSCLWLFGIPITKKIIDKTLYPMFGLKPDLDLRVIEDKNNFEAIKNSIKETDSVLKPQKQVFDTLKDKAKFLGKKEIFLTNEQLYKTAFYAKFIVSTAAVAFGLNKLISYKQKTTEQRIEKDYYKNNASKILLNQSIKQNDCYGAFTGKNKNNKNISFKGKEDILKSFLYNPIENTKILDGTIAATRLNKARKGEKFEVAFREGFSFLFIYYIAKPLQYAFEFLGDKLKVPIKTDPSVIFTENIQEKISSSKDEMKRIINSDNAVLEVLKLDSKNTIVDLLEKSGEVNVLKNSNGEAEAISRFKYMNSDNIKSTLSNILELGEAKNINHVRALKTFAVIGNVALAILAIGKLQPKLNILLRKIKNNGDNRNPAIVAKQKEMEAKFQQN